MSKRNKILLALGIAAFAALVIWAVATVPEAPKPTEPTQDSKVMTYDGNTIREEKDGRTIWELTAEHIQVDVETKNVTFETLSGKFYAKDGRTVEIHADGGNYDDATKDIAITGNVAITTSDGAKLSSKELRWTAKEELLAAVGDATAVKDDMKASGDRIESTDGFNKIKIIGKAHLVKGGTSE